MFESVRRSQVVRGARGYLKCFGFRLALTLAVAAGTVGSLRGAPQTPDFTGVDRFWEVADTLQQDREPTNDAWDALFSTPGYGALERREGRRSALQQGIRLALKPSLAAERESALASTSWTARVVRHIQQLPPERADLQRLRQQLAGDDVEARAMTAAQTLLPEGTTSRWPPPPIAFVFFLPDGRGYPDIIVADLANLARQTWFCSSRTSSRTSITRVCRTRRTSGLLRRRTKPS